MVTIPKGYVSINLVVPQHIKDALESEIIERWGYLRRGIIGEIARTALEEYINKQEYEKTKISNKKNGLALKSVGDERVTNKNLNVASEISIILSDIKTQMIKSEDDAYYIPEHILIKILIRRLGLIEKRGQSNKIEWMVAHGLLTRWQEHKSIGHDKKGFPNPPKLINHYFISPEFLNSENEELPALK